MSHFQQQQYCTKILQLYPNFFHNKIVLDVGALDINGNNSKLFTNCMYIGLDIGAGNNVDFVAKGHEFNLPDNSVDTIISTECFEHDMYYQNTLRNIYRMLKPGGLLLFTCATNGRAEHGTKNTTPNDAILLQVDLVWSNYYKNLTVIDIEEIFELKSEFSIFEFAIDQQSCDLYFYGFKRGNYEERNNYSFLMNNIINTNAGIIQLFYSSSLEFNEANSFKLNFSPLQSHVEFEFLPTKVLRFDPLDRPCKIIIKKLTVMSADGASYQLSNYSHNGVAIEDCIIFAHPDSQLMIELEESYAATIIKFLVDIIYCSFDYKDLIAFKEKMLIIEQNNNKILHIMNDELQKKYELLNDLEQKSQEHNEILADSNLKLQRYNDQLELDNTILNSGLKNKELRIEILLNTWSWKLTTPFRFIKSLLKK